MPFFGGFRSKKVQVAAPVVRTPSNNSNNSRAKSCDTNSESRLSNSFNRLFRSSHPSPEAPKDPLRASITRSDTFTMKKEPEWEAPKPEKRIFNTITRKKGEPEESIITLTVATSDLP